MLIPWSVHAPAKYFPSLKGEFVSLIPHSPLPGGPGECSAISGFFSRLRPRLCLQLLSAALVVGCLTQPAQAQTTLEDRDYDLVADVGLYHYSQTDGRWAQFPAGPARTRSIHDCGCLLSVLATVINHQVTGISPWFPTELEFGSAFDFNPRYLDLFFNYGPSGTWSPGWGYKKGLPPDTCGIIPLTMALQSVGQFGLAPVGVEAKVVYGFGSDVKAIVNRNLNAGRPTIVMIKRSGGPTGKADHAVLIAGWERDAEDGAGAYRFLDPTYPRTGWGGYPTLPKVKYLPPPTGPGPATHQNYLARIKGIIDIRGGFTGITPGILFGDDPSPIDIVMTGPDGRRTGVDAEIDASFDENPTASYWTFGPWSDPLGETRVSAAPRFIAFPNAPAGTYHFKVTGTADGPLQLSSETIFGGTRVLHGEFGGTIAAGEVRKYELQFARTGTSTVAQVSNFTPHAYAGDDLNARTDAAITFDGRRSFDADGTLASFAWDFGDGTTGDGARPQHVYAVPGDYTVTLTVTDANGVTATDSLQANVILSQRRPVAHASGPYLGFASASSDWYVLLDARGSTDPNSDSLTYRWDFGDGSPTLTTTAGFTGHVYAAMGVYTLTLVVNDGIEDSAPATTSVEIVQAPTNLLTHSGEGVLTPNCGVPGDTVTLTIGSFAQFQWWNFGTMGALPPFPPTHLILGLSAPDGMMNMTLPDGERAYVPFHATLLSPGRYMARATFTVPDVTPGLHDVGWTEDGSLPFRVPCPVPSNQPPRADAGGPYADGVWATIAFDGSASSDPDGDEISYEWDFGDGEKGEGDRPLHTYAREGRYIVTLTVFDWDTSTASFARATITATSPDAVTLDATRFSTVGLTPASATNPQYSPHTVTATATSSGGAPVSGVAVSFRVLTGPNTGQVGSGTTDVNGRATFNYWDDLSDPPDSTDTIQASIGSLRSNIVSAIWQAPVDCTAAVASLATPMFPLDQGWRGVTITGVPNPTVTQVCQDEAPNFENVTAWAVDALGVGGSSASVRAQRSGTRAAPGNGRVYHLYFDAGSCSGHVTINVPVVANGSAVDGGPRFNSVTGAACQAR